MSIAVSTGRTLLILSFCALLVAGALSLAPAATYEAACGETGWYFAEGYTGGSFDTWILIQNPQEGEARVEVRFLTGDADPITLPTLTVGGETRTSIYLNSIPGLDQGAEVATEVKVTGGGGIICERAMYFDYESGIGARSGGHSSIGAHSTSTSWYLPEGYTGGDFDTFVLLMNPGVKDAEVQLKLMKPADGRYYPFKLTVPAGKRRTIKLDDLVWTEGSENAIAAGFEPPADPVRVTFDDTDVSTWVLSDRGIVAERAMYFDYYGKEGGSNSIGATGTSAEWYLPEGYTGGDFDTWVMAMNPNSFPVDITYTFYSNQEGSVPVSVTHRGVPRYSRDTINVDTVPGLEGVDVSTKVTATRPVTLQAASVDDPVERYALLYGVEGDGTPNTEYAGYQDTYDLKHRLVDYCGFTYDKMRYRVQENDAYATDVVNVATVLADLDWLASVADANDIVLFYYAGTNTVTTGSALKFSDGEISAADLAAKFDALAASGLVALFDCDDGRNIADAVSGAGRVAIGSSGDAEARHEYPAAGFTVTAAVDAADGNGAFTYYFVEALCKAAADTNRNGLVGAEEAFGYARSRTTALVTDKSAEAQTPYMNDQFAGDDDLDLTVTEAPAGIVAERSCYFNYGTANDGATSIGAPRTCCNWFLAEGYTGGGFDTYVLIMNPYDNWQRVTVNFMTPLGALPPWEFDCPPNFRYTIPVDAVPGLEDTDVSTRVYARYTDPPSGYGAAAYAAPKSGVAVERAMYFTYTDPGDGSVKTGGSCSIGFGE